MRISLRVFYSMIAVIILLSGWGASPIWAASERTQTKKTSKVTHSCYTDLTMMVRGSSFPVADQLRASLRLRVERDDGERVLLLAYGGSNSKNPRPVESMGWLLYHPTTQKLQDVSKIVENEDIEAAFIGESGRTLTIDRRFAYLFDQCRQRHDVKQVALCQQIQQKNPITSQTMTLQAQGRVGQADEDKNEKITLYSAPDATCPISETLTLKTDRPLKIYHEAGEFYFVRQDNFNKDFITGWIMKQHVKNVKFLQPPASAQLPQIEVTPVPKPVTTEHQAAAPIRDETQVEEIDRPTETAVVIEDENIPIPLMIKPLPADGETHDRAAVRRERIGTIRSGSRRGS